jgi:hypothetical protein
MLRRRRRRLLSDHHHAGDRFWTETGGVMSAARLVSLESGLNMRPDLSNAKYVSYFSGELAPPKATIQTKGGLRRHTAFPSTSYLELGPCQMSCIDSPLQYVLSLFCYSEQFTMVISFGPIVYLPILIDQVFRTVKIAPEKRRNDLPSWYGEV